ncbi:3'-5' exonuclease [uncultured Clostridium sp.]|uniref:3'-5' exonuclease n=1 Tax=uncultured Clostridium sp. TaxID=59620 RepID=UPI00262D342A|nr:3'-5' exonuclease [uncultured Clostridium sp.]
MELNTKQNFIVNEHANNILLLASAGTGKTDTLAKRIAKILSEKKATPQEILCITFTNKACKEMKERIETIVGTEAKDITIKTFHSFCFDIIKQQAKKKTDIFTDFLIFDEEDCKELLGTCNYFNYPVKGLKDFIDLIKREIAKSNIYTSSNNTDFKKAIQNIFIKNEDAINDVCRQKVNGKYELNIEMKEYFRDHGADLIKTYSTLLNINHGLDFNDLISNAQLLFNDIAVVESLNKRYKFINIDEMQDTSKLEYSIVEKLFKDNNILLCGDIFQTIYEWRGSEPEFIFETFRKKYKPVEVVFDKNYRATQILTNASVDFLENAFPTKVSETYKDEITSETSNEGEKISLAIKRNINEEAQFIVSEVDKLVYDGSKLPRTCIITRDNKYNTLLSANLSNLRRKQYDFVLVDQYKFFRRQEIKDMIAFLKLIANRNDSLSLNRILKRLPVGIGKKTLDNIDSNEYKQVGITLADYIDNNSVKYGEKYGLLIEEFEENNVVIFDVESTGIDVTEDEIIQIAAIKLNNDGKVIDTFERFLKNKKSVKKSELVHGFSDDFLSEHGEEKEIVLLDFLKFSENTVIVGHNVQYDINILASELERLKLSKPNFKGIFDTLDIFRRFYPNAANHKLETLSNIFDTENKPTHNAMDDILATGQLLKHAINEYLRPTSLERIALMGIHLKSFEKIREILHNLFITSENKRAHEIIVYVMNIVGLKEIYKDETGADKISRLRDFYRLIEDMDILEKSNRDSLLDVIKMTGLSNGELEELMIKRIGRPRIPIITAHQAKGLEFDYVFLSGAQENVFPSFQAVKNNKFEEEKRTFYVAITRAKKKLYITSSKTNQYGYSTALSRFIKLISDKFIDRI